MVSLDRHKEIWDTSVSVSPPVGKFIVPPPEEIFLEVAWQDSICLGGKIGCDTAGKLP